MSPKKKFIPICTAVMILNLVPSVAFAGPKEDLEKIRESIAKHKPEKSSKAGVQFDYATMLNYDLTKLRNWAEANCKDNNCSDVVILFATKKELHKNLVEAEKINQDAGRPENKITKKVISILSDNTKNNFELLNKSQAVIELASINSEIEGYRPSTINPLSQSLTQLKNWAEKNCKDDASCVDFAEFKLAVASLRGKIFNYTESPKSASLSTTKRAEIDEVIKLLIPQAKAADTLQNLKNASAKLPEQLSIKSNTPSLPPVLGNTFVMTSSKLPASAKLALSQLLIKARKAKTAAEKAKIETEFNNWISTYKLTFGTGAKEIYAKLINDAMNPVAKPAQGKLTAPGAVKPSTPPNPPALPAIASSQLPLPSSQAPAAPVNQAPAVISATTPTTTTPSVPAASTATQPAATKPTLPNAPTHAPLVLPNAPTHKPVLPVKNDDDHMVLGSLFDDDAPTPTAPVKKKKNKKRYKYLDGVSDLFEEPKTKKQKKHKNSDDDSADFEADQDSLRSKQLKEIFSNFGVEKSGTDPDSKVSLFGMVFEECLQEADGFQIEHVSMDSEAPSCKDTQGFHIVDKNKKVLQCARRLKKSKATCGKKHPCVRLSKMAGSTIKFDDESGNFDVKLYFSDENDDKNGQKCEDIAGSKISHKDKATIQQEKDEKAAEERRKQVAKFRTQLEKCKGSLEALEIKKIANAGLLSLGEITERMAAQTDREIEREAERLQGKELARLLKDVKDVEKDSSELREQLKEWADAHPEDSDKVVNGLKDLAQTIATKHEALPEDWDKARDILKDAQEIIENNSSEVKTKTKNLLKDAKEEVKIGRLASMAQFGVNHNPYKFWNEYAKIQGETSIKVWNKCTGAYAFTEECSNAIRLQQSVRNLPNVAMQAEMQQAQLLASYQNRVPGGPAFVPNGMMNGMFQGGPMMSNPYGMMNVPYNMPYNMTGQYSMMNFMNPALGMNYMNPTLGMYPMNSGMFPMNGMSMFPNTGMNAGFLGGFNMGMY